MGEITAETDNLQKVLSANIKKYRAIEGISQEKLAEITGLSDQLIKDIEGRRSWVSAKTIVKLASALKVEAYQLLYPEDEASCLYPVRLPAGILRKLHKDIKKSIDRHFEAVVTDEEM